MIQNFIPLLLTLYSSSPQEQLMNDQAPNIYQGLTKRAEHLQNMLELSSQAIEHKTTLAFDNPSQFSKIKESIFAINQANQNIQTFFGQLGLQAPAQIVKKLLNSSYLINLHLLKICENHDTVKENRSIKLLSNKQNLFVAKNDYNIGQKNIEPEKQNIFIQQSNSKADIKKIKLPKMGGISLYRESYCRKLDKETIQADKNKHRGKSANELHEAQPMNYQQFKVKLFSKMEKEIKQAEQALYSPVDDETSSFISFEKKFIESFNHHSRIEDLENIVQLFHKSTLEAADFLKKTNLSEEVSKFQADLLILLKNLQQQKIDREKGIGQRFEEMLTKFVNRHEQFKAKMLQKITKLQEEKQNKHIIKVHISTETNKKELQPIKLYKARIEQLQEKLTYFQIEKQKKFNELLEKLDQSTSLIKSKQAQISLALIKKNQEINLLKIQIQKLNYLLKEQKKKTNLQIIPFKKGQRKQNQDRKEYLGEIFQAKQGKKKYSRRISVLSNLPRSNNKIQQFLEEQIPFYQNQVNCGQSPLNLQTKEREIFWQYLKTQENGQRQIKKIQYGINLPNEEQNLTNYNDLQNLGQQDENKRMLNIHASNKSRHLKSFKALTVKPTQKCIVSFRSDRLSNFKSEEENQSLKVLFVEELKITKDYGRKNDIQIKEGQRKDQIFLPSIRRISHHMQLNFQSKNVHIMISPKLRSQHSQATKSRTNTGYFQLANQQNLSESPRSLLKLGNNNNLIIESEETRQLKQNDSGQHVSESKKFQNHNCQDSLFSHLKRKTFSSHSFKKVLHEKQQAHENSSLIQYRKRQKNIENLSMALQVKRIERGNIEKVEKIKERAQSLVGIGVGRHENSSSVPNLQTLIKYKSKKEKDPNQTPKFCLKKQGKEVSDNVAHNRIFKKKLKKNLFVQNSPVVELPIIQCRSYAN